MGLVPIVHFTISLKWLFALFSGQFQRPYRSLEMLRDEHCLPLTVRKGTRGPRLWRPVCLPKQIAETKLETAMAAKDS